MVACFGLNSLSFLAVIVVLSLMQLPLPPAKPSQKMLVAIKGGLSYVKNEPTLLALTVLALATTSLGLPIRSFLPVFAEDAAHLSRLMTAVGAGAVAGALSVAWLGTFRNMGRTLLSVQIAFAGCVVAFAVLPFTIFSYVILFGVGATLLVVFALISSLVQLTVPNELRGRVLSIYLVAFRGGTPIGSLISGYFIGLSSASTVLAVNGLLLAAVAALFLIRSRELQEL